MLSELAKRWRALSRNYGKSWQSAPRGSYRQGLEVGRSVQAEECASELEAALGQSGGWTRIEEIPEAWKDGRDVLLWVRGRPVTAHWFEAWGIWHDQDSDTVDLDDEIWGIGSLVPTHARLIDPPPSEPEAPSAPPPQPEAPTTEDDT